MGAGFHEDNEINRLRSMLSDIADVVDDDSLTQAQQVTQIRQTLDLPEAETLQASDTPDKPTITIPRTVQRREDMSPNGRLLVILQEDGDVVLDIAGREEFGERERATAEFCAGGGGGQSPRTVEALKLLMAAMQADNDAGGRSRDYERQYHFTLRPEDQDWSK